MAEIKEYFNLERTVKELVKKVNAIDTDAIDSIREDVNTLDTAVDLLVEDAQKADVYEASYTVTASDFTSQGDFYVCYKVCPVLEHGTKYEVGPTVPTFQGVGSMADLISALGYNPLNVKRCAEIGLQVAYVDLREQEDIDEAGDDSHQYAVTLTANELPEVDETLSFTVRVFRK